MWTDTRWPAVVIAGIVIAVAVTAVKCAWEAMYEALVSAEEE
jgi:hypothetical protein